MNSRNLFSLLIPVALAVTAAFFWSRTREHSLDEPSAATAIGHEEGASLPSRPAGNEATMPSPVAGVAPAATSSSAGAPVATATSADYLELAESLLDAANRGDARAQYQLYSLLKFCDTGYRLYFIRGNSQRTLDEALQWASTREPAVSMDEIGNVYTKCHRLKSGAGAGVGNAGTWLASAAQSGHPVAQVELANTLLTEASLRNYEGQGSAELSSRGLALLSRAVQSKDPAALWKMGELQAVLAKDQDESDPRLRQAAWSLVACQRGYDCSPRAEWYRSYCRFDTQCRPDETGVDLLRRSVADKAYEVEQLAKDISAALDANDLQGLGLAPE